MKFRATAFVRLKDGGIARHRLGAFDTGNDADQAIENAVDAFADYARWDGPGGTSRLLVRNVYRAMPLPPGPVNRVDRFRDDAANE